MVGTERTLIRTDGAAVFPLGDRRREIQSRTPWAKVVTALTTAPEGSLLFLHCLDVLPPYGGGRFTQSECPFGQLQIVCCKPHQMFSHARLSTLLCESYA